MKISVDDLKKTYNLCVSSGNIKEKRIDIELIKSLKSVAEKRFEFINAIAKNVHKESTDWTFIFVDYYESLRGLIEAYLLFDGVKADSHQCKNAYVCFKHSELELHWEFMETIRLKRNAINYEGVLLKFNDWKSLELEFKVHFDAIRKEVGKKLKEFL